MTTPLYQLIELFDDLIRLIEWGACNDPFANGNIVHGMDEGSVTGWDRFEKIKKQKEKLVAELADQLDRDWPDSATEALSRMIVEITAYKFTKKAEGSS